MEIPAHTQWLKRNTFFRWFGLFTGFVILLGLSSPAFSAEDCPKTIHYGEQGADNQLTLRNNGLERHFHVPELGVVVTKRGSQKGLQVRFPYFIGNGHKSYLWPQLAERFKNRTDTYLVHQQAMLDQRAYGCFTPPSTSNFEVTQFRVEEWSDPSRGTGHLKGRVVQRHKDGSGIFARVNTRNVVILDTQPVSGEIVHESFSGETSKVKPESAYIAYTPTTNKLKLKIFAGNKTEIVMSDNFTPDQDFVTDGTGVDKLIFIVDEFTENSVKLSWRKIPFISDLDLDSVNSLEQARTAGKFRGRIESPQGYTEIPAGDPIRFEAK